MEDAYFRRPLIYDYIICVIICAVLGYAQYRSFLVLPEGSASISTATDLATIALTIAGFILTLLTVLITFKTAAKIPNGSNQESLPLFDLFFSTSLYYQTTELLKGGIKSLIFVAVLGFSLKIFLIGTAVMYIFYSNITGLIIIITTLWRSLVILSNIIKLQKEQ